MANFPYVTNTARIAPLMSKLQEAGQPPRLTQKWIGQLGFTSKNDRPLVQLLKDLGFADQSYVPTSRWQAYRHKAKAKGIMATAVREAYGELFSCYPNACTSGDDELRDYFSANTSVGASTVTYMVRTFKVLCSLAEFAPGGADEIEVETRPEVTMKPIVGETPGQPQSLVVNINIQLELPATPDATIYDKLFESLRKNLLQK